MKPQRKCLLYRMVNLLISTLGLSQLELQHVVPLSGLGVEEESRKPLDRHPDLEDLSVSSQHLKRSKDLHELQIVP